MSKNSAVAVAEIKGVSAEVAEKIGESAGEAVRKPDLEMIANEAKEGVRIGYNEFLSEARAHGVKTGKSAAKKFLFGKFGKLTPEQMYAFAQGDDAVLLTVTASKPRGK